MKTVAIFVLLATSVASNAIEYRPQRLDIPSGAGGIKMNEHGDITYHLPSSTLADQEIYVRSRNGETRVLPVIPNSPLLRTYGVGGIADDGTIWGLYSDNFFESSSSFVWREDRGFHFLPESLGYWGMNDEQQLAFRDVQGRVGTYNYETSAIDYFQPGNGAPITYLANNGWAVSQHGGGQRWLNGVLAPLQPAGSVPPIMVTDNGYSAGGSVTSGYATIWNPDGSIRNVFAAGLASSITINSSLQGFGGYRTSGQNFSLFYYSPSTGLRGIDTVITQRDENVAFGGVINLQDSGIALAWARVPGQGFEEFETRYYMLTPVPEPGTMLALGAGLAALLRRRRDR